MRAAGAWPDVAITGGFAASALDLLALSKPRITVAVVVATATGLLAAPERARLGAALSCVAGTALMSAGACALNMWFERESDARMARTALRPLPAARLQPRHALLFAAVMEVAGAALLAVGTGPLCLALGVLSLVLYSFVYTPLKRRTPLAFTAGLAPGALPALMGASAASGEIDARGFALFALICLWQVPHTLALHVWQAEAYASAGLRALGEGGGAASVRRIAILSAALLALAGAGVVHLVGGGAVATLGALFAGIWFAVGGLTVWPRNAAAEHVAARRFFRRSLGYLAVTLAHVAASGALRT